MTETSTHKYKFFPFYLKNSPNRIKSEWTIILCVSISLSLVSGLNYFFEAAQKQMYQDSFWLLSDFDIAHQQLYTNNGQAIDQINYGYYFNYSDNELIPLIQKTHLDLQGYAPYAIFNLDQAIVTIDNIPTNTTLVSTSEENYYERVNATAVRYGIFDQSFYNSSRFNDYFQIMDGRAPAHDNEIMVDMNIAPYYNYQSGKVVNISMQIGHIYDSNPVYTNFKQYKIENMTVVGTYLCKHSWFRIVNQRYSYRYTYKDYQNNKTYVRSPGLAQNMLFMYGNFSNLTHHPVQDFYYTVFTDEYYRGFLQSGIINSGYLLFYDRDSIEFDKLYYYRNFITQTSRNFSISLPFEVALINKLSFQLLETHRDIRNSFLVIQILNVPIIVFSLLVSQNITDSRGKKANEELILLKLREVLIHQIQAQLIFGGVVNGVVCTIFGSLLGNGTFYLYHRLLGELFFDTNNIFLKPLFVWSNLYYVLFLGIIINVITIIPKAIRIRKMDYSAVTESLQQVEQLSLSYDEKVLFEGEVKRDYDREELFYDSPARSVDDLISQAKSPANENNSEQNSQVLYEKSTTKRKKTSLFARFKKKVKSTNDPISGVNKTEISKSEYKYEKNFEMEHRSVKILTYFLLSMGLIPIFVYSVTYASYRFEVSDTLLDLRTRFVENIYYIHFFSLFFIGMFIAGLIRFLLVERPSRFARFAKFIAHIFNKKLDHVVSLELIRKKKWSRVIIYLTIFFSMLTTVNITFNSQYRYEIFNRDMIAGADVRYNLINTTIGSQVELQEFEQNILSTQTEAGQSLAVEITRVFCQNNSWAEYNFANSGLISKQLVHSYMIDPEEYLHIISTDKKPNIYPAYPSQIRDLTKPLTSGALDRIGVIVSNGFLGFAGLEIGDSFDYIIQVNDNAAQSSLNRTYRATILHAFDFAPGLYRTETNSFLSIICDINALDLGENKWSASDIIELIDINSDLSWDNNTIDEYYSQYMSNYASNVEFQWFDPTWNDIDAAKYSLQIGSSGFYGLINLDFMLIGFLLAIELALTIIIMNRENAYFNELLLMRGVGRNGIIFINMVETFIAFLISMIIGGIIGYLFSWFICSVNLQLLAASSSSLLTKYALFPVYSKWGSILMAYGVIFVFVLFVVFLNHRYRAQRNKEYLNKENV